VRRACDQALQMVHDLPPMFGLESYVEGLRTLVTLERSDATPQYVGVWGMGGVEELSFFEQCMRAPRYVTIFKERSSFDAQWGELQT
jgi:hypothetical protein